MKNTVNITNTDSYNVGDKITITSRLRWWEKLIYLFKNRKFYKNNSGMYKVVSIEFGTALKIGPS